MLSALINLIVEKSPSLLIPTLSLPLSTYESSIRETWYAMTRNSMKYPMLPWYSTFPILLQPRNPSWTQACKTWKMEKAILWPICIHLKVYMIFHFTTPSFTSLTTATVPFKFQTINLLPTHHQTVTTTLVKQRISLMIERRKGCSLTENLLVGREWERSSELKSCGIKWITCRRWTINCPKRSFTCWNVTN